MAKIQDERILAGIRKINSQAFSICLLALWLILIYRILFLRQAFIEYADIFLLTFGVSLYVSVRNVWEGYTAAAYDKTEKKKNLFVSSISATVAFIAAQIFIIGYDVTLRSDMVRMAISAFVFFITWIGTSYLMHTISKRQGEKDIEE